MAGREDPLSEMNEDVAGCSCWAIWPMPGKKIPHLYDEILFKKTIMIIIRRIRDDIISLLKTSTHNH